MAYKRGMRRAAKCFGLGAIISLGLLASTITVPAADERETAVRSAAIKIMQAKLGPLRGSIPITARKTLLTRQMLEQLKPIPQSELRGKPGIDMITTNGVAMSVGRPKQSFPSIDFDALIAGN